MRNRLPASCLLSLTALAVAFAADAPDPRIARVESGLVPPARIVGRKPESWSIPSRLAHHQVPGVSIAVIDAGQLAWSRAYGVVNRDDPTTLTTASTFPAGAIADSITAATLLTLADSKDLSLDTPLTSFPATTQESPRPTLRQLLSHTAGLAATTPLRVETPPGTRWRPSAAGYEFTRQLATTAANRAFPELVRERVLTPAGMTSSTVDASGILGSTPADLARFLITLSAALNNQPAFLSRASVLAMITPPLAGSGYGLGIGVTDEGEKLQLAHSGSADGFRCALVFYPHTGRGAVVMTNSDHGGPLINEILRSVAAAYDWPHYRVIEKKAVPLAETAFDSLVGRYQHENDLSAVFRDEGHFYFQIRGQKRREIFPQSELEFFFLDSPETLAFDRDRAGRGLYFVRGTTPPQIFQRVR